MSRSISDTELAVRLRRLYAAEMQRAEADLAVVSRTTSRAMSVRFGSMAAVASLILMVSLVGGLAIRGARTGILPGASQSSLATQPGTTVSARPAAATATGFDGNGIPTKIDGQSVLTEGAILAHVTQATDDHSFLVGGWFQKGQPRMYCPAVLRSYSPWEACGSVALFRSATDSGSSILIRTASFANMPWIVTEGEATRPVVLKVDTHDSRCPSVLSECPSMIALLGVVWEGPAR
jgi:hypothetical protein